MAVNLDIGTGFKPTPEAAYTATTITTPTWSGDIWLAGWVRRNDSSAEIGTIFSLANASSGSAGLIIAILKTSNYSQVNYDYGYKIQNGSTNLSDGAWHHICGVLHRAGSFRSVVLYEDGVLVGESAAQITSSPSEAAWDSLDIGFFRPTTTTKTYKCRDMDLAELAVFSGVDEGDDDVAAQLWACSPTLKVIAEAGAYLHWYCPLWKQEDPQWCSVGGEYTPTEITTGTGAITSAPHPPVPSSLAWAAGQSLGFRPRAGVGGILVGV